MNSILPSLRSYADEYNIPILSQTTESFLKNYIQTNYKSHIIEIGSAIGYSSIVMLDALQQSWISGTIKSWEISYPHYYQALRNTTTYSNITFYLWNFCHYPLEKALKKWHYDMVFIDWRKSETLQYLKLLIPYLTTTTSIIIDDVIKFKSKMTDFYDFLDKNNISYEIKKLDEDDGILIIQQAEQLLINLSSQ